MLNNIAGLGGVLGVVSIVLIFLPKAPSAEEIAIKNAVKDINKNMERLHDTQMQALS